MQNSFTDRVIERFREQIVNRWCFHLYPDLAEQKEELVEIVRQKGWRSVFDQQMARELEAFLTQTISDLAKEVEKIIGDDVVRCPHFQECGECHCSECGVAMTVNVFKAEQRKKLANLVEKT